jgi:hypothetical protein
VGTAHAPPLTTSAAPTEPCVAPGQWRATTPAPRQKPSTNRTHSGAAEVVSGGACAVPTTAWSVPPPNMVFRPLVDPVPVFTWSMMLAAHAVERPEIVALARCVRELSHDLGWLGPVTS